MMVYNFKGKNFVLTGGGKGIGKATLERLYKSGANVALITRSKSDIDRIKKKYVPKRVLAYCGDVTKENDINKFFLLIKKV